MDPNAPQQTPNQPGATPPGSGPNSGQPSGQPNAPASAPQQPLAQPAPQPLAGPTPSPGSTPQSPPAQPTPSPTAPQSAMPTDQSLANPQPMQPPAQPTVSGPMPSGQPMQPQPAAPSGPMGPGPMPASQTGKKGGKKKLFAIIGAALLLLVVLAFLVYTVFFNKGLLSGLETREVNGYSIDLPKDWVESELGGVDFLFDVYSYDDDATDNDVVVMAISIPLSEVDGKNVIEQLKDEYGDNYERADSIASELLGDTSGEVEFNLVRDNDEEVVFSYSGDLSSDTLDGSFADGSGKFVAYNHNFPDTTAFVLVMWRDGAAVSNGSAAAVADSFSFED